MRTVSIHQGIKNRRLFTMLQQTCQLLLFVLLLLLTLNGLTAQRTTGSRAQHSATPKIKACNSFNSRNKSLTCECKGFIVTCVNIHPHLIAVPVAIMKTVRTLELNNNNILTIEKDDFLGLEQIQTLLLHDNMISYIHPDAFKNLFRLEILNLKNNRLGVLDPSGRTFQHLSSLHTLSLENNNITKINKYSFFTLAASGNTVSVHLDQNPIQCDCDVLALKSWQNTLPVGKLQILNLICENDQQKRSYQDLEDSLFGSCNDADYSWDDDRESYRGWKLITAAKKYIYGKNVSTNEKDLLVKVGNPTKHNGMVVVMGFDKVMDNTKNQNQITVKTKSSSQTKGRNSRNLRGDFEKVTSREEKNNAYNIAKNRKPCREKLQTQYKTIRIVTNGRQSENLHFIYKEGGNEITKIQHRLERDASEEQTKSETSHEEKDQDNGSTENDKSESDGTAIGSFADKSTCYICRNERTNHGCILQSTLKQCTGEMVCHRSVAWSASAMTINSQCESYQSCLTKETANKETCVTDSQNDKDVLCHFCCRGPTCTDDSIGGRTKDFTFSLSYIRSNAVYESYMADSGDPQYLLEEDRIDKGIRQAIHSLKGGVDVYLLQFMPQPDKRYEVVLRLEVTVFTTETEASVEQAIKEDIMFSIQEPNSFFRGENMVPDSFNFSSIKRGSFQCPESVSYSLDKGNITWKVSSFGLHLQPCPYLNPMDPESSYATRRCMLKPDGTAAWDDVHYSFCGSKNKGENPEPENLFDIPLSSGNAQAVSASLKIYTEQLDNFTVEAVNNVMNLLEQLLNDTMLEQPGVAINIVDSVSSLINIDHKALLELELKTSISARILAVIDYISEKAPLTDGKLMIVTSNIVIAAQGVNGSETQDVVLTADSISEDGLNNSKTMGNKESRETQFVNTTKNYFCEQNNSYNCPKTHLQSFTTKINSHVISASVPGVIVQNLSENITMSFVHNDVNATNPRCVFWNKYLSNGTGEWSDEGCGIVVSHSGETTCGCNHLTNFALLMDIYQEGSTLSELDRKVLSIISYVGCGISFFALLLTILSYSVFRSWNQSAGSDEVKSSGKNSTDLKLRRDNPSKILINLCVALMLTNLVYLAGMHDYTFDNTASCKAVAVLLHYFLLSSLAWMAVEAFYMYLALVRVFKAYFSNFILKCSVIGWGVPLLIVAITLGISATENYGFINSGLCWLRNPAFYAAFVGPVCFILLINCLAFGLVIRQLVSISSSELSKHDRNSTIQHLRAAIGVVILLGLTWLFAIFAIGQASVVFYYLFAVFNSLQGLFIFIYYCLLKKDAFAIWKRSLPCFDDSGEMSKTSSNSKAMTAVAATHHRAKHDNQTRSESSTFLENTVSIASTRTDPNCYFNKVDSNNTYDSSEDCDTPIITETFVDSSNYNQKTSPLLLPEQQHSSVSKIDNLPSYTSSEYDAPSKDNYVIENSQTDNVFNIYSKSITSTSPECQSGLPNDAYYNTATLSTSSYLSKPTFQHPSETINDNFTQLESPERRQSNSKHEEGKDNSTLSPSTPKGDIDYSSQAEVSDVQQKLELSDHETTDKFVTHF